MARVTFENVGKKYGKLWALREFNARFEPGETVSVIGPNGSGKTTMIKCLLGLVQATTGTIIDNWDGDVALGTATATTTESEAA